MGRVASLTALLVFLAASALGLLAARHAAPLAVPATRAVVLGARDPNVAPVVAHATSSKVLHLDGDTVSVTWFRAGRAVATTTVDRAGRTDHAERFPARGNAPGAPPADHAVVLAPLALLFLLATLRGPLLRTRTLDALALAAFAVPAVLEDESRLALMQASGAALLAYILIRSLVVALRGTDPYDNPAQPVLLERAAARLRAPGLTTQLGAALLLATVLITLTSTAVIDVATADMEGATTLAHGLLPYGHLPGDVVHGDTYGLPIYLVHLPVALLLPVHSSWDDQTGALVVATLALLACAAGIARATGDAPGNATRWPAVIALLAFPAALLSTSSGTNDGLIAAALVWALAWSARPALSSAVLAGAGVAKVAPLVLLPLWLARLRGAALRNAILATTAVALATLAALIALGGLHGPADMVHAMTFQLERRSAKSPWTLLGLQPLQPFAQAATLAIALGGAVAVARDRALATDPRRTAALLTAVLAGLQLQANHWAPLYLLWLAPPAMAALLGRLGARAPAPATAPAAVPAAA